VPVDWAAVREEFPALRNWTYLNTATLGLIPRRARAAVDAHFARRDELAHTDFYDWWDDMDHLRGLIAQMIHAPHANGDDIAFLPNASAALAIAKGAVDWKAGDELLTLEDEFPNQVYASAGLQGVRLIETNVDQFWDRVTPRTRMVAISAVNYQTGLRAPWEAMIAPLRERGIFTYIDATQSFGALVNDVRGHQPDIYAVNCYKWACAPTGAAFACIHQDLRKVLKPSVIGWRSDQGWRDMENLRHGHPVFSDAAARFEGGMLPFPSLYALKASMEWMLHIGPAVIQQRVLELAKACGGDGTSPIVALTVEQDAPGIAARLREQRILVSARRGKLRISPHFYNNESDVECFQKTAVRISPARAHASPT
jgi:selenocysteine lyase/cysteine desulfurase